MGTPGPLRFGHVIIVGKPYDSGSEQVDLLINWAESVKA